MTIRKSFIILCITIAVLAVLEVIARIILSDVYNRKFDSSLIEEGKYGSSEGLKANASSTVWGKPFHTDEMGGRKHNQAKKGKKKLLIIGDSVTEGVGVDDTATFASLIDKWSDSSDVHNISLIGWSSFDYRNAIDSLVSRDTAIKKIYLFYCLNDIYGRVKVKDMPPMAGKGILSDINFFLQDKYSTYKLIKLLVHQNNDNYYKYDEQFYKDTSKVNAVMTDIGHIQTICKSNNVEFEIFVLPYRSQLYKYRSELRSQRWTFSPQMVIEDEFVKKGIPFFDMTPAMAEYYLKRPGEPKDLYLFADEIHLSAKGHYAVADILGEQ